VRVLAARLQRCRRYWRGVMMTMYRHRRWACRRRVAGLQPPAARGSVWFACHLTGAGSLASSLLLPVGASGFRVI
jgi:hypothetical protein